MTREENKLYLKAAEDYLKEVDKYLTLFPYRPKKRDELETKLETPDFQLDLSTVRVKQIKVFVSPVGWCTKLLWRFLRLRVKCEWEELQQAHGDW